MTELLTEFGSIPGMVLLITVALVLVTWATCAFISIGSRRWKVVGEGVVDEIETLEVPAGITPMDNGFISPPMSLTMVRFTDGTRTQVPYDQVKFCIKGRRIQVLRNWIGERKVFLTSLFD